MRWRRTKDGHSVQSSHQSDGESNGPIQAQENAEEVAGACSHKMVTDSLEFLAEVIIYMVAVTLLVSNFQSLLVLWMICAVAALANIMRANRRRFVRTARRLVDTESGKAAGPLAEWLITSWDTGMLTEVRQAMIRFLPRMEAQDAKSLTPKQRRYLRLLLAAESPQTNTGAGRTAETWEDRKAVREAILQSFRKIGDEQDLQCVERLADSLSDEPADSYLRTQALECIAEMNARLATTRGRDTLLRSASAAGQGAGELLRGTVKADETPAEQLLRGSNGEEQEQAHLAGPERKG